MTKTELVDAVATKTELGKKEATDAVTAMFDALQEALAKGDTIAIKGFGTFSAADRNARTGKNPQTGEKIAIAATRVPKFKPGKALKDAVAAGK